MRESERPRRFEDAWRAFEASLERPDDWECDECREACRVRLRAERRCDYYGGGYGGGYGGRGRRGRHYGCDDDDVDEDEVRRWRLPRVAVSGRATPRSRLLPRAHGTTVLSRSTTNDARAAAACDRSTTDRVTASSRSIDCDRGAISLLSAVRDHRPLARGVCFALQ